MLSTQTNSSIAVITTTRPTGYQVGDRVFINKKEYLVVEIKDSYISIVEINDATREANILIGCIILAGILLILAIYFVF